MSGSPERGLDAKQHLSGQSYQSDTDLLDGSRVEISLIKDVLLESRSVGAAAGGMYQLKLPLPWWLLLNYLGG